MKKLTDYMAEELSSAFEKAGYDPSYGKVGVSNRPDLCEYQCNGAMAGAKAYKKAPFMIADDVVANLADSKVFSMKEMVKPGFINLKVSEEFLADYLKEMEEDEEAWCRHSQRAEDHRDRLRRTKRCQAAPCRTSSFCHHWREH